MISNVFHSLLVGYKELNTVALLELGGLSFGHLFTKNPACSTQLGDGKRDIAEIRAKYDTLLRQVITYSLLEGYQSLLEAFVPRLER